MDSWALIRGVDFKLTVRLTTYESVLNSAGQAHTERRLRALLPEGPKVATKGRNMLWWTLRPCRKERLSEMHPPNFEDRMQTTWGGDWYIHKRNGR